MPRYEDLDPDSQAFFRNFKCREDGPPPWTALDKPLSECRVALVTTSGLIRKTDRPFDIGNTAGDPTYRVVPTHTDPAELTFSHTSTNWDRTGFTMDTNVVLPAQRLEELVAEGVLGSLGDEYYALMGAMFDVEPMVTTTGPALGRHMKDRGVDIALLVPT
jgi:D-proline reductase (dithiol) PrdB